MSETRKRGDGLWHHPGFLLLWSGQTVSQIGSQATLWGLPLIAVLLLKVTPFQMGVLALMGRLPLILIGIVAGAWVDRSIVGPGLAGILVQLVSGAFAILADAISFVVSAASLAGIHVQEVSYNAGTQSRTLLAEIGEGLRFVWQNPVIRALAISSALFNLFDTVMGVEYVLYLTRTLGMGAAFVGLVGTFGGVGWLLGTLVTKPFTQRLGLGRALIGSILLACIAKVCIAIANGPFLLVLGLVTSGEMLFQCVATVYVITGTSLRQACVSPELYGRVTAVVRVVSWGIGSFGALLGGILAEWSDLRTTMIIAALGTVLALIWIVLSPVRCVQSL